MSASPRIPVAKPIIGGAEQRAVAEVLASGQLGQGPRTAAFEEALAELVGVRHAVAVSSGTAALVVALQAHGIGAGDEVITTPFSFIATATSIIACGAEPVFVDVDPFDLNLDPAQVEGAISERTSAILPAHLYGHPARLTELAALCSDFELALIEDAAQAVGAGHAGQPVGSFGTGCFSFYPTKNVTSAEGGMITTDEDEIAARARSLRDHGQVGRYNHELLGLNWRLSDVHAAIGLAQLAQLDDWQAARVRNAAALSEGIARLETPRVRAGDVHSFNQYTVRVPNGRERFRDTLLEAGVGTAIHYPTPLHHQPVIRELGYDEGSFPIAETAAEQVVSLPVHPSVTETDLATIVAAVNAAT